MTVSRFKDLYSWKAFKNAVLTPQVWDRIFQSVDSRLVTVENLIPKVDQAITDLANIGITRINELLLPAFEKVRRVASLGFLAATSSTSHYLQEGTTLKFVVDEGDVRDLFTPGKFLTLGRTGSADDYGFARLLSYNRATGELVVVVLSAYGGQGPFTDWEITTGVGLSQRLELRWAQITALQAGIQANADAAAGSASTASTAAGTATSRAAFADTRASDANNAATRAGTAADRAETAAGTVDGSIFILKDGTRAFTGKAKFAAGAAGGASVNLPVGTDPSAPVEGDVWNPGGGILRGYIGGATHRFAFLGIDQGWNGQQTFNRPIRLTQGGTSVTPTDGDVRVSIGGLHVRFSGAEHRLVTAGELAQVAFDAARALRAARTTNAQNFV